MEEDEIKLMDKRETDSLRVKNDLEMKIIMGIYSENVPTIKKISEDYNIGTTTASKIMQTLVSEGVLYSMQGKGYYVIPYCRPILTKKHTERLYREMKKVHEYAIILEVDFVEMAKRIVEQKNRMVKIER